MRKLYIMTEYYPSKVCEVEMIANDVDLDGCEVICVALAVWVIGSFTGFSNVISAVDVGWDAFDDDTVVTLVNLVKIVVVADDVVIIIDADPSVKNFLVVGKPVEDNNCL